ncbi:hypothetical protein KFK09_023923 [Dendrobium nobile]|uniref:Uncharacterized protein n=1 Tax=Dendrobium nobile TaxID=94219 RepID=A0A8T3ACF8_DENNO|nr:hypothetical protein KFK09_023923 [Dendrobium nobile]
MQFAFLKKNYHFCITHPLPAAPYPICRKIMIKKGEFDIIKLLSSNYFPLILSLIFFRTQNLSKTLPYSIASSAKISSTYNYPVSFFSHDTSMSSSPTSLLPLIPLIPPFEDIHSFHNFCLFFIYSKQRLTKPPNLSQKPLQSL